MPHVSTNNQITSNLFSKWINNPASHGVYSEIEQTEKCLYEGKVDWPQYCSRRGHTHYHKQFAKTNNRD